MMVESFILNVIVLVIALKLPSSTSDAYGEEEVFQQQQPPPKVLLLGHDDESSSNKRRLQGDPSSTHQAMYQFDLCCPEVGDEPILCPGQEPCQPLISQITSVIATPGGYEMCGGIAGFQCSDPTHLCIDDPTDNCDPNNGGADCSGICIPPHPICGGIAGFVCPGSEYTCEDDPSDNCDPANGGADCIGRCVEECGVSADCNNPNAICAGGICVIPNSAFVQIGEICADIVGENLEVNISTNGNIEESTCALIETHICNLPIAQFVPDELRQSMVYSIDVESVYGIVCSSLPERRQRRRLQPQTTTTKAPDTTYTVFGHATISCDNGSGGSTLGGEGDECGGSIGVECDEGLFCKGITYDPEIVGGLGVCTDMTCDDWFDEYQSLVDALSQCETGDDCEQIPGTSCGCTRNLVLSQDADMELFRNITDLMVEDGCSPFISTCDCPAADGFKCEEGKCAWNYLDNQGVGDEGDLCLSHLEEACNSGLFCKGLLYDDGTVGGSGVCTKMTCSDWTEEIGNLVEALGQCETGDDCIDITGTSCGCTRNLVLNVDADLELFWSIWSKRDEDGCTPFTTCDCPPADGFKCEGGQCAWNYV